MTDEERDAAFRAERRRRLAAGIAIQRDTGAAIVELLRLASLEVRARLAGLPTAWESWYLPQLDREVRGALARFEAAAAERAGAAAGDSWRAGVALVDAPLAAAGIDLAAIAPAIDDRQLRAMRTFLTDRMRDVGRTAAARINAEIGLAAIGAQGIDRAAGRVSEILETGGRQRALTVIRTELGRAFSAAADERIGQAATRLPGMKKLWRRSGKRNSRSDHDLADGQVVAAEERFLVGGERLRFPRDPRASARNTVNCGCTVLPHMDDWPTSQPGAVPFSPAEIAADPRRRDLPPGQETAADRLRRLRLLPPAAARREVAAIAGSAELGRFLAAPAGDALPTAVLPAGLQRALGAQDRVVRLSAETAAKIARKHPEVTQGAVAALQGALGEAGAVRRQDRGALVAFVRHDGAWWRGVIKRTRDGREVWLATLHRSNDQQRAQALARWPVPE